MTSRELKTLLLSAGGAWRPDGVELGGWRFVFDGRDLIVKGGYSGEGQRFKFAAVLKAAYSYGMLMITIKNGMMAMTYAVPVGNGGRC